MPRFQIRMINSDSESFEEADYTSLDVAEDGDRCRDADRCRFPR